MLDSTRPTTPGGLRALAVHLRRAALLGGATLLAAACGGERPQGQGDAGGLSTTIDTVGGVVHVRNSGTAPAWEMSPVTSIGPDALALEQGPQEFGDVVSVAFHPAGDAVFVADRLNCEIRVFDLDGAHLRTLGRCGEGPGELTEWFFSVAWVGDRLLALDFGNGRIGEFSAEGEWLGQRRIRAGLGGGSMQRLHLVGPNEAYAFQFAEAGHGPLYVGHDVEGLTRDSVPAVLSSEGTVVCSYRDGWVSSFTVPFGASRVRHPGPGGTKYSAMTDEYRIALTRGDDTLRVIEREMPAEPITDEEWEAGNQEFWEFLDETPDASCEPRRPERPDAKPLIDEIWVAPDGRLWVEVVRSAGNHWEIFDADGVLLGRIPAQERRESTGSDTRLPPAFAPAVGLMATVRQDSVDLDHVDIFRITERQ